MKRAIECQYLGICRTSTSSVVMASTCHHGVRVLIAGRVAWPSTNFGPLPFLAYRFNSCATYELGVLIGHQFDKISRCLERWKVLGAIRFGNLKTRECERLITVCTVRRLRDGIIYHGFHVLEVGNVPIQYCTSIFHALHGSMLLYAGEALYPRLELGTCTVRLLYFLMEDNLIGESSVPYNFAKIIVRCHYMYASSVSLRASHHRKPVVDSDLIVQESGPLRYFVDPSSSAAAIPLKP